MVQSFKELMMGPDLSHDSVDDEDELHMYGNRIFKYGG